MSTPPEPRHAAAEPELSSPGLGESRPSESAAVDTQAADTQPAGTRAADTQLPDTQLPGTQPSVTGPGSSGLSARQLVSRPPEVWAGAVFLTLAALPLVALGAGLALSPGQFGAGIREQVSSPVFRVGGALVLVLAVALVVLAWRAVLPNRAGRTFAAALAGLEAAGLVVTMILTTADAVSVGMLLLAVAGVVLLYLPRSEEFMYTRR